MPTHIAIFCQVVDNYGDIGVSWRLARQWVAEAGLQVTLWVDDWISFQKICAELDPCQRQQTIAGVSIGHWFDAELADADVVLEMFGCTLPDAVLSAMPATRPLWLNLEYLSAEDWVEGCHGSASPQLNGLTRYFFFPGFTEKTGGLLAERDLLARRAAFAAEPAQPARLWRELGVPDSVDAHGKPLLVSLFCYPAAPLADLFDLWAKQTQPVYCLIAQGVASEALLAYWQSALTVGQSASRGALTVQIIPFLDQREYDRLLWACDINFVRGEDSFVRAQWAGQPLVWHIYPQEEQVHLDKLQAFMARYTSEPGGAAGAGGQAGQGGDWQAWLGQFVLAYNCGDAQAMAHSWPGLLENIVPWRQHSRRWAGQLAQNGNLADNLLQFIQKIV